MSNSPWQWAAQDTIMGYLLLYNSLTSAKRAATPVMSLYDSTSCPV